MQAVVVSLSWGHNPETNSLAQSNWWSQTEKQRERQEQNMAVFGTLLTVYQSVAIAFSVECEYGFECSDNDS